VFGVVGYSDEEQGEREIEIERKKSLHFTIFLHYF
jgi:hypothetical protein